VLGTVMKRTPEGRFEGRCCLVTGGGRGIGRAVALALAGEGGAVAVVSRTARECEDVAREIGERGTAIATDVTDFSACEGMAESLRQRLGPPEVVVHAAGISPVRQRAERHDPVAFRQIVDVNLIGAFNVVRAVAADLLETQARVVLVSSTVGLTASPRLAGYGASKAALVQLVRTLAREWADRGVRVNAVCPGYVLTALTERMFEVEHIREEIISHIPCGRLGTLEEVVEPVLFLASDAAAYVTGVALPVDGGMAA
jgi:NAD(P)-dependent dehydrogenase (short-subunit alcohol dehydrogenase family)